MLILSLILVYNNYGPKNLNTTKDEITIELSIDFAGVLSNWTQNVKLESSSVYNITQQFHDVDIVEYSYGILVKAIDNVIQNNNISNYFWIYYVNGLKSNVGADKYVPIDGDIILWSYQVSY